MAATLEFELVSPEKLLVSEAVEMVVVPGAEGDIGVLPGHAPLITALRLGVICIFANKVVVRRIFVAGGFAEVTAQRCTVLAEEAARLGIPLVHFSTDYVFAGQATAPYRETDATAPQSVYGRTKLAGEAAIIATGCPHLIFRTSWVYGAHGNNFVKTILRLAQTRDTLSVVSDQLGAPTSARLLADTTLAVVSQLQYQRHGWLERSGIYHLTPRGQTHWHAFACAIVRAAQAQGMNLMLTPEQIRAIPTTDYPTPAQRPAYSCLDSYKLTETFGLSLPDWADDFALNFPAVRAGCV